MWNLKRKIKIIINFIIIFAISATFFVSSSSTNAMGNASDRLSLTWPATASNHSITFKLTKDLPAGGKIVIIPESNKFFIGSNFNYKSVDLATSTAPNAIFYDRIIASSSSFAEDGVSVVASSSNGSIEIRLNSVRGIDSGTYVNIELGTNAIFGASSSAQIVNPTALGSYRMEVKTYNASDVYLERAVMLVAIVYPVQLGAYALKLRSRGTPSGVLGYGTSQIIMSLATNYTANCRWSNTASTTYISMTETFTNTGNFYHSSIISGFVNGTTYYYYVRCLDAYGVVDTSDFEITFLIAGYDGEAGTDDVDGSPGSGGSGSGSGGGGGGGGGATTGTGSGEYLPFPELPNSPIVAFQGWAYPNSKVILLKDGEEEQTVIANTSGIFNIDILELPQGVYTFNLWGEDNIGRKSVTESFTFYVKEGTKTELYDIYLPPTIDVTKASFDIGDNLEILGQSASKSNIELWLYPKVVGGVTVDTILKASSTSETNGDWFFNFDTSKLINGPYQVKARSSLLTGEESNFSKTIDLMVGGELPTQACAEADLNDDGKVNITDFSILLYWWTSDNECADQNSDGTVNLIDFSIMMYYWTG